MTKHLDRRKFLTESAFLAAAASMAPSLGELSAQEKKDATQPGKAGDKLRVAVVGVNGRGMSHIQGFANRHNCVVTVVCDADKAVATQAMRHCEKVQPRGARFEQDVRKVVEDRDVDIVAIATPNHWHALNAIWAMQNGKDVYVEKPVSHNVLEGRRIIEAAEKYNKICQAGTQSRSTRGMQDAIAFLRGNKIGRVTKARGLCYKLRPSIGKVKGPQDPPATMDYNLWCGPASNARPQRRTRHGTVHYDWHWIWEYGNGDLGNQGIHEMDKARWGLGKNTLPKQVMSIGGRLGYEDDGQTPNSQVIWFDYEDAELVFEVRGLPSDSPYPGKRDPKRDPKRNSNFVGNIWYGENGYVVCPSYSGGIAYDKDGEFITEFRGDGDHFANFVRAVRSRRRADLNGDILQGHLSSAMCHLGNISHRLGAETNFKDRPRPFGVRTADDAVASLVGHLRQNKLDPDATKYLLGQKLTLDVAKETFTGNNVAAANRMLTREYRRGFEVPARV